MDRGASALPFRLAHFGDENFDDFEPNLSRTMRVFLEERGLEVDSAFYHSLAVLHSPCFAEDNEGALSLDWPRVPVPSSASGQSTSTFRSSSLLGERVAALLHPETPVAGVTAGEIEEGIRCIALPSAVNGRLANLALTAGWGFNAVTKTVTVTVPGQGKLIERPYRIAEREALFEKGNALRLEQDQLLSLLGETTCDVWLNEKAYWANIPTNVWRYQLGGYQVIKKWLSYREKRVLGRALRYDEVLYVTEMARRIAAILLMGPELDANYRAVAADAIDWQTEFPR
jgi:Type ISP C-terminal specificity domain